MELINYIKIFKQKITKYFIWRIEDEVIQGFDLDKMFVTAKNAIEAFAKDHTQEIYYAFSIDSSLLCLNSLEKLKYYQEKYPEHYSTPENIEDLKYNTGDWEYQGFFDLNDGFNEALYSEHYNIPFENTGLSKKELDDLFNKSLYHKAMSALLKKIQDSKVLDSLNKTDDFKAFLSEHNY
jgi:hypothetical protein